MQNIVITAVKQTVDKTNVIITTNCGDIWRRRESFLIDLENSGLIDSATFPSPKGVKKVFVPITKSIRNIMLTLPGATINGDIEFYQAGSTYLLDEFSTLVKEGKGAIGETKVREKAGSFVARNSVLHFTLTHQMLSMQLEIDAKIEAAAASIASLPMTFAPLTTVKATEEIGVKDEADVDADAEELAAQLEAQAAAKLKAEAEKKAKAEKKAADKLAANNKV